MTMRDVAIAPLLIVLTSLVRTLRSVVVNRVRSVHTDRIDGIPEEKKIDTMTTRVTMAVKAR